MTALRMPRPRSCFKTSGGFLARSPGRRLQMTPASTPPMARYRWEYSGGSASKFAALARRNAAPLVLKDKVLAADNGLLAADLAGNAVGDDVLHLAVHLVVADALCGGGLHDGVRHRVGVVLLRQAAICKTSSSVRVPNGTTCTTVGVAWSQRAGLVKDDGIGVGQSLRYLPPLTVIWWLLTHGGQHGQRHRQLGAQEKIDHQDRDRTGRVAGQRVGHGGAQQAVHETSLSASAAARVSLADFSFSEFSIILTIWSVASVAGLLLDSHGDLALLDDGARVERPPRSCGRARPRRSGGLVDAGLAVQHPAVQRDDAAGVRRWRRPRTLRDRHKGPRLGGLLPDAVRSATCERARSPSDFLRVHSSSTPRPGAAGNMTEPAVPKSPREHRHADGQRVEGLDLEPAAENAPPDRPENIGHAAHQRVDHTQVLAGTACAQSGKSSY